jgi:type IV pilus assembly protein PilY1
LSGTRLVALGPPSSAEHTAATAPGYLAVELIDFHYARSERFPLGIGCAELLLHTLLHHLLHLCWVELSPTGTACDRRDPAPNYVDKSFPVRGKVNCYLPSAARSLTIARLDNGEILRSFRQDAGDAPAGLSAAGRVTEAPLDSPVTGTPVAFPGTTGAIADRIFVGDRDGMLWRVDVAATDPAKWEIRAFFDAFSGLNFDDGQTIQTPPVLSVDVAGNVTLAFSTGDQEVLTAPPEMKNFVFSLTEELDAAGAHYESKVNWFTRFTNGERVAGPMTLFNGALFFSSFRPEPPTGGNACAAGRESETVMTLPLKYTVSG